MNSLPAPRAAAERTPGVAALGVVGAGLVTGALIVPMLPTEPQTAPVPAVVRAAAEATPQARTGPGWLDLPVATGQVAAPVAPAAPAPAAPAASPALASTPLERTGLDGTCVDVGGAGAGGADCAAAPQQRELSVVVPVELDLTPAGVETPTVATDRVPCRHLPDVPLTRCTTPGDDQ
jgi:hypothetical protein